MLTQYDVDNERETKRQMALKDMVTGFANMAKEGQTKRAQALALSQDMKEKGYDVNPEVAAKSLEPEQSGFGKWFAKTPIGQSMGMEVQERPDLYGKRTAEWTQKNNEATEDRKFKRESELFDREYKMASLNKERGQNGLDNQKKELELQKLQKELASGPTPNESQFKAAGFSKRARQATEDLSRLPGDIGTSEVSDTLQGLSFFPDALKSENRKLYEQAKDNFISANLRKESGAAIGAEERVAEDRKYFPQPGDPPSVVAQKARAREQAILNLEAEGSPAIGRIADAPRIKPGSNTGSWGNEAAAKPAVIKQQLKGMSREEKIRMLQGGR